jgi:predicted AlkP superfamily pyrophosphatase or phosphodiesterase
VKPYPATPIKLLAITTVLLLASGLSTRATAAEEIRLVLQITVDGFRADLLERYHSGFGNGGFNRLTDDGVVFRNAHYQHANTETIVGHTTLATGAQPAVHGMTGNVWYDEVTEQLAYNIEDSAYPPLASREHARTGTQVDPSQQLARTQGRSPRAILAETFADRLMAYYGGKSRVFGVSGKDRSAVAMAGQVGKAFWMSTDSGDFVTSTYYYDEYPQWTRDWNAQRLVEQLGGTSWQLQQPIENYVLGHQDDRPYEVDLRGYGRTFPHPFADTDSPVLPTQVLVSPHGDALTADFAQALLVAEQLGADSIPDYLSVSFSSVDAVNHFFGPSSLENEAVVLQLDRTLAGFLDFIDDQVGLEHTLIVLSADHGMAEMPEYMTSLGYPAERLYPEVVIESANESGERLFGISEISRFFFRPYLYLDNDKIAAAGLEPVAVRAALARSLESLPGIRLAQTRDALQQPPTDPMTAMLKNNFHSERSGDIYVVQSPYWFNFDKGPIAAMHGSPWRYDTHVPIIFAGADLRGTPEVFRQVQPADVAPTLAAMLGMSGPASASGEVLPEVAAARRR